MTKLNGSMIEELISSQIEITKAWFIKSMKAYSYQGSMENRPKGPTHFHNKAYYQ